MVLESYEDNYHTPLGSHPCFQGCSEYLTKMTLMIEYSEIFPKIRGELVVTPAKIFCFKSIDLENGYFNGQDVLIRFTNWKQHCFYIYVPHFFY